MSLDPSLKSANALIRHRNVLTRDERLAKLKEEEKWRDGMSVFGLPKVGHRKQALAKAEKAEVAADGTTPVAGAAGAAPAAAGAKGAAPAAGAKGAAPAGKGAALAAGAKGAAPAAKAAAPAAKKK
jgi:small basic protein (TIGR04137 family)